jgi:hypothetical protein
LRAGKHQINTESNNTTAAHTRMQRRQAQEPANNSDNLECECACMWFCFTMCVHYTAQVKGTDRERCRVEDDHIMNDTSKGNALVAGSGQVYTTQLPDCRVKYPSTAQIFPLAYVCERVSMCVCIDWKMGRNVRQCLPTPHGTKLGVGIGMHAR